MKPGDFQRLIGVEAADVYKAGRWAATLRRVDSGVEFAYRREYLEEPGPAVATTLPLGEAPQRTQGGAVPPFFAGLLPEGRRLSALRRAIKTSADDELSLLLAVGSDAIGDVQVVPAGEAPEAAAPLVQVERAWTELRFAELLQEAGVVDPVALPGVQDKVSARVISLPLERRSERYLLKLNPPEYPHIVENEAYFLALARRCRMETAEATVVRDAEGRPGLLVRRFDRSAAADGSVRALACEDACQVLGRWPADKYRVSCKDAVQGLVAHCAARSVALRALYQQLCFGWLTGNGDIHAKNLSILATPDGEWRVSPAYDLPSTVPYGDKSFALSLQGHTTGISRRHLLDFAAVIDLPQRSALRVLDALLEHLTGLEADLRAGALPFDANTTRELVRELRYRRRHLLG